MVETNYKELSKLEMATWSRSEATVARNAAVFHDIIGRHHNMLIRAINEPERERLKNLDRALALLAAKTTHLVRSAWIGTMCGYPGGYQPLARAVLETSLTMFYLRKFPGEFGIWKKEDKTREEERKFWPSSIMRRLDSPATEKQLFNALAQQAHPNAVSTTLIATYDAPGDRIQIDVGAQVDKDRLTSLTDSLCLYAAVSAYTIARTVNNALVDGVASQSEVDTFFSQLQDLLAKRDRIDSVEGTPVFEIFKRRQK